MNYALDGLILILFYGIWLISLNDYVALQFPGVLCLEKWMYTCIRVFGLFPKSARKPPTMADGTLRTTLFYTVASAWVVGWFDLWPLVGCSHPLNCKDGGKEIRIYRAGEPLEIDEDSDEHLR